MNKYKKMKEFDFDKIGKRLPYDRPNDFLDNFAERSLSDYNRRERGKSLRRTFYKVSAIAASVIILITVTLQMKNRAEFKGYISNDTIKLDNIDQTTASNSPTSTQIKSDDNLGSIIKEMSDEELAVVATMFGEELNYE